MKANANDMKIFIVLADEDFTEPFNSKE